MKNFLILLLVTVSAKYVLSLAPQLAKLAQQFTSSSLPVDVSFQHRIDTNSLLEENSPVSFLLDISVRDIKAIESLVELYPFVPRLLSKMQHSKQTLKDDKFLHVHDIGIDRECKVVVARVPLEMYQKLDLSRRLAGMLNGREAIVHTLADEGRTVLDADMSSSLVSAIQANIFSMPSLKSDASNSPEEAIPFKLSFVSPAESLQTASDAVDFSIQVTKEVSPLEQAMLEASRRKEWDSTPEASTPSQNTDLGASLRNTQFMNEGTNLARALSFLPPNILTPSTYASFIEDLADHFNWEYKEWYAEELKELGFGAVAAVTSGNAKLTDRLVKLTYKGIPPAPASASAIKAPPRTATIGQFYSSTFASNTKEGNRPLVLVGKGVCYDTGGINLKTANSMKTMKHDMGGSAAALGLMWALQQCEYPAPVESWLILVENNINTESYRPDEVVKSVAGETIEVVHSDAEGRMLLADILAAASRKVSTPLVADPNLPPKLLIDFATLTGTCITSLSNKYVGAMTNRKDYVSEIILSGEQCGERVWPFPCDEDFDDDLKSDIADVLQCRQPTEADHIYAFSFLRRFMRKNVPWIHLDLGSAYKPGGLGQIPTDYTGSGVRVGFQLVQNLLKW